MILKNIFDLITQKLYFFCGYIRASYYGIKIGSGAQISPFAKIKGVAFIGNASIAASVSMGKGTYINSGSIHSGEIGCFCSIGYDVHIGPTEHNFQNWTNSPILIREDGSHLQPNRMLEPPKIDDDVWIGAAVIVLRGSEIGTGSVIGAGSVVKGRIPPYEIWAGSPAKFIKKRFVTIDEQAEAQKKLHEYVAVVDHISKEIPHIIK